MLSMKEISALHAHGRVLRALMELEFARHGEPFPEDDDHYDVVVEKLEGWAEEERARHRTYTNR